jgi:hypothetical protein
MHVVMMRNHQHVGDDVWDGPLRPAAKELRSDARGVPILGLDVHCRLLPMGPRASILSRGGRGPSAAIAVVLLPLGILRTSGLWVDRRPGGEHPPITMEVRGKVVVLVRGAGFVTLVRVCVLMVFGVFAG